MIIMNIKCKSWLILLLLVSGCDSTPSYEECFRLAKLTPIIHYKILKTKSSEGLGEYIESSTLKISRKDYNKIKREIENKPFYIKYDSTDKPEYAYDVNSDLSKISEVAYFYKGESFYEHYNPKKGIALRIVVYNDSLMFIEYNNL